MSWSNWIYLVVGISLGVSSRWWFRQIKESEENAAKNRPTVVSADQPDLTTVVAQLKQTEMAYHLANQISQFKAGFLARISHELRSPLNSLIGLHQLILADLCDDPAEEREFVAQANASALKLITLIDKILAVARIEHGTNQLNIQPLQLNLLLESVYQLVDLLAADRNIHLYLSPPEPTVYILADPLWLQQVLVNLLENSIAQMPEGCISISTQLTPTSQSAQIWLDVQLPLHTWSEPIHLMQSKSLPEELVNNHNSLSPGFTLLLNQTLLELMHSRLEIASSSTAENESSVTRLQLTIPLWIPETAELEGSQ